MPEAEGVDELTRGVLEEQLDKKLRGGHKPKRVGEWKKETAKKKGTERKGNGDAGVTVAWSKNGLEWGRTADTDRSSKARGNGLSLFNGRPGSFGFSGQLWGKSRLVGSRLPKLSTCFGF